MHRIMHTRARTTPLLGSLLALAGGAGRWVAAPMRDQAGAFNLSQMLGIIGSVVILVVGLVLYPIVTSTVTETINDPNIDYFTGAAPLIKLAPLLYTVGILGLAGSVAVKTFQTGSGSRGGSF